MAEDYIIIMCPYCGLMMDVPYPCDGTFSVCHAMFYMLRGREKSAGCKGKFYVAINDGKMYTSKTFAELMEILKMLHKEEL